METKNNNQSAIKSNPKLLVLKKIASCFNSSQITYALGGSLMLNLRGIQVDYHDIDLMVTLSDSLKADKLLQSLGTKLPKRNNGDYTTKFFGEYVIDGVDVDLMAEVSKDNPFFVFSLEEKDIDSYFDLDGISIPLHSIKKWLELYKDIKRTDKISLIEKYYQR
jgi:alpha-amylase/alpha-mannosidase (GH57 family)